MLENIPRVLPDNCNAVIDADRWDINPVFGWISCQGRVSEHEMSRTFNCGIGAVLIVESDDSGHVLEALKMAEEQAWAIGKVGKSTIRIPC